MKTKTTSIDPQSAKVILRDFYLAVRKEINCCKDIKANIGNSDEASDLHFICDGFDLHFILKATNGKGGTQ